MPFSRLYVSEDIDNKLRVLKMRTGLLPNLICRMGFCLSLSEPGIPDVQLYSDTQAREFNRYTLTGQYDLFFFALLRERLSEDGLDTEAFLEPQFKAHISRGVGLLYQRVRSLEDVASVIVQSQRRRSQNSGSETAVGN